MATAKTAAEKPKLSFAEKVEQYEKTYHRVEPDRIFIPTGSIGLNWALGGGWQTGRLYEVMAWEGAGKTTLCKHAIAECQALNKGEVVAIDSEHAFDPKYARRIGVNWDHLKKGGFFQPDYGEEGYEYAKGLLETGEVRLLILDSMNGLKPKKELEDPAGSSNLGLHARLQGVEVLKLKNMAAKHNCAIICISQFREKIGVMFGSPETTQGGNALKYWADCRVDLRRSFVKEGEEEVGLLTKVKVIKNKIVAPFRRCEIPLRFGVGIDKLEEVIQLGKKLKLLKTNTLKGVHHIYMGEDKWPTTEFVNLLHDNPGFYESVQGQIIASLNADDDATELIMEEDSEELTQTEEAA